MNWENKRREEMADLIKRYAMAGTPNPYPYHLNPEKMEIIANKEELFRRAEYEQARKMQEREDAMRIIDQGTREEIAKFMREHSKYEEPVDPRTPLQKAVDEAVRRLTA